MFMAREDPVKITRLRLVNRSDRTRRLSLFSYLHWALGGLASDTASAVAVTFDAKLGAILAVNPNREQYESHVAFSAVAWNAAPGHELNFSCDRAAFLGRYGDLAAPAAIASRVATGFKHWQCLRPMCSLAGVL